MNDAQIEYLAKALHQVECRTREYPMTGAMIENEWAQNEYNRARFMKEAAYHLPHLESLSWSTDMEKAPRDGTEIIAKMRTDLTAIRDDLDRWDGQLVVLKHPGITDDGYDFGWTVAAPVGHGGIPDEWIARWRPAPHHQESEP